jgi:ribonuclease T2
LAATPGGDFDYFVLALSWSPDYCSANADNDPQQCGVGKKLGFVLHGLWPQYTRGYPSDCSNAPLPKAVKTEFGGLYPNDNLFTHEWSKHGTCSGLDARGYLELTRQLKQSVAIPDAYLSPSKPFRASPDELKLAFEQTNPGFGEASFEVNCSGSGRYLKELDVCFAKDGQPAACGADVHKDALKSCASPDFLVRSTR